MCKLQNMGKTALFVVLISWVQINLLKMKRSVVCNDKIFAIRVSLRPISWPEWIARENRGKIELANITNSRSEMLQSNEYIK